MQGPPPRRYPCHPLLDLGQLASNPAFESEASTLSARNMDTPRRPTPAPTAHPNRYTPTKISYRPSSQTPRADRSSKRSPNAVSARGQIEALVRTRQLSPSRLPSVSNLKLKSLPSPTKTATEQNIAAQALSLPGTRSEDVMEASATSTTGSEADTEPAETAEAGHEPGAEASAVAVAVAASLAAGESAVETATEAPGDGMLQQASAHMTGKMVSGVAQLQLLTAQEVPASPCSAQLRADSPSTPGTLCIGSQISHPAAEPKCGRGTASKTDNMIAMSSTALNVSHASLNIDGAGELAPPSDSHRLRESPLSSARYAKSSSQSRSAELDTAARHCIEDLPHEQLPTPVFPQATSSAGLAAQGHHATPAVCPETASLRSPAHPGIDAVDSPARVINPAVSIAKSACTQMGLSQSCSVKLVTSTPSTTTASHSQAHPESAGSAEQQQHTALPAQADLYAVSDAVPLNNTTASQASGRSRQSGSTGVQSGAASSTAMAVASQGTHQVMRLHVTCCIVFLYCIKT